MHSRMQSTGVPGMECSRPQSASPTVPVRVWSLATAAEPMIPAPRITASSEDLSFLKSNSISVLLRKMLRQQRPHLRDEAVLNFDKSSTSYTLNEDPQPQVLFTFGFSNLKPAPSSVST